MSDMNEKLHKLREERKAREKARLERLREFNLNKYNVPKLQIVHPANHPASSQLTRTANSSQIKSGEIKENISNTGCKLKNSLYMNGRTKQLLTAPAKNVQNSMSTKAVLQTGNTRIINKSNQQETKRGVMRAVHGKLSGKESNTPVDDTKINDNLAIPKSSYITKAEERASKTGSEANVGHSSILHVPNKVLTEITKKVTIPALPLFSKTRKSISVTSNANKITNPKISNVARKSMMPTLPEATKSQSVFERLYKPKQVPQPAVSDIEKLKTDPNFLKTVIKKSEVILNNCHTNFDSEYTVSNIPRRSLSAVHLKRISKSEASNCIHKWYSISGKLNNPEMELHEDHKVKEDKVASAIKSEHKKVQFMTPTTLLNTPKHEELQARLKSWLQKRGQSFDSYHHLKCFGVHLKTDIGTPKCIIPSLTNKAMSFDEENKENIAVESDSDDGSYADVMNEPKEALNKGDKIDVYNWRRASIDSESVGFNDSVNLNETTLTSAETLANVDDLLIGALNDLSTLLREGFDWQQAARWLRTIRERFPNAPLTAAYWECRAALEDSRGNLPASVQCWEEAIAKGTKSSVVDANLDQLLDKFMELKISPKSGASRVPDPKLVDVKNVFKSTIIRFAVQQAKIRRHSGQQLTPVYSVTPVRRSARLSQYAPASRTPVPVPILAPAAVPVASRTPLPLRLCGSVREAAALAPQHVFTPNKNLVNTP